MTSEEPAVEPTTATVEPSRDDAPADHHGSSGAPDAGDATGAAAPADAEIPDPAGEAGAEPAEPEAPRRTPQDIAGALEALLLMAEEPVPAATFAAALDVPVSTVSAALQLLRDFYDDTGRGFELRHLGGGWRYYTRAEHAEVISSYVLAGQQSKLSQAALETLAVIAYRQPISRARVSAVRGVNVDGVVRTLLARNLIAESGHDVDSTAVLFVTTDHFLERMGLDSLDQLPPLAPHLPEVAEMEAELAELATPAPAAADAAATGQDGDGQAGDDSSGDGQDAGGQDGDGQDGAGSSSEPTERGETDDDGRDGEGNNDE